MNLKNNNYKRLELYVGWTCNQKCTYCKEFPNMEVMWSKKVTKYDILKRLIEYKILGYNHVSYLGGEPFIQSVFLDALKLGKKMQYTTLVTTNCTTLHIESQAKKYLPYIDELILSVEAVDKELQQKISRTNTYVRWDEVFKNINKYWKGRYLKANIVITKDNLSELFTLVKFLFNKGMKNIAITYPDIDLEYYGKLHVINRIAPSYNECLMEILQIIDYCEVNNIKLKLPDFPFCIFPINQIEKYIKLTDDYDYQTRVNLYQNNIVIDRGDLSNNNLIPRERTHINKCKRCIYNKLCWGPSRYYKLLYGLDEINTIGNKI